MESSKIKISVMIPVYNTSQYLKRCLNSIINQSLKEIEIICVNDGSTDNSLEILKEYEKKDKRIVVIDKKNAGVSSAKNEALKIAKGKYCLNIDSDDWVEQNFFKEIFLKAEENDLDLVVSDIIFDYDDTLEIKKELEINDNDILSGKQYRELFFNKKFQVEGYTWNKLIKTSIYKKNNIFFSKNIAYLEDYEIILKLAFYLKKIGKINKGYYHYIQRNDSASNNIKNRERNFLQEIQVFNNLENFYKDKDVNSLFKLKRKKIFSIQYSIFKSENITEKMYLAYLSEIKKEKFILKKYQGEKIRQVLLFNTVKLFNSKLIVKVIKKFYIYLSCFGGNSEK